MRHGHGRGHLREVVIVVVVEAMWWWQSSLGRHIVGRGYRRGVA